MSARTDVHRVGAVMPVDYTWVMSYSLPSNQDTCGFMFDCSRVILHDRSKPHREVPGIGMICAGPICPTKEHSADGLCCVTRMSSTARFFHGVIGKCDICGASYNHGDVWLHVPTQEHIHVGHECAEKYNMFANRSAWEKWHADQKRFRAQAAKDKRFKTAALRFMEQNAGLADALALADANAGDERLEPVHPMTEAHQGPITSMDPGCPTCEQLWSDCKGGQRMKYLTKDQNDRIFAKITLADMSQKLNKYGSMSEKQVAFALKLADTLRKPVAEVQEERHVPAPTGRVDVVGKVVSVKVHESQFGSQLKMTVKVETPEGSWLVWTTVPAQIAGQDIKGRKVSFTATLSAGNTPHFAFGKRPTNGAVVQG